jgi:hypothetical protein
MKHSFFILLILPTFLFSTPHMKDSATVIIYGGTSSAVIAAVQVSRMGESAIIVCPEKHLGGLTSSGLGWTDAGRTAAIGGLAREFYRHIYAHYQKPNAWRWQKRDQFSNAGQGTKAMDDNEGIMWIFEPHVAEAVFEEYIKANHIRIFRNEWLDRSRGVIKTNGQIRSIVMLSGKTFSGKMFIDATYEGDLMAAAGVSYHVGREANSVYQETWNGVQTNVFQHDHYFKAPVDPYIKPGDPASGLIARISADPPGDKGAGDKRIQAYCYRMCLSNHPDNRVPFARPGGYDRNQYQLLSRVFAAGWRETFNKFDAIPNRKTDTNNHGPFSFDNIGMNYDYPEADYTRRQAILKEHETYQKGLLYFLSNDESVPMDVREQMQQWGLAKDEFKDNGHWPWQIYVREARRLLGEYVMTEQDVLGQRQVLNSAGMGSYTLDSHNVQRYITPEGLVQNEGDIGVHVPQPYRISYGSLTPKRHECENLLVPVCASCSHIAYGSIRMEPVFMILGQSAATAAVLAIRQTCSVQELDYALLRQQLLRDGQHLQ